MNRPRCLSQQDPKRLLEEIASDTFKHAHEILDQSPRINLIPEYCYDKHCIQIGICIYNQKGKNYFLNNNNIVLN